MSEEKSNFGGLFSKLGKLVFTEEYISSNMPETSVSATDIRNNDVKPTSNTTTTNPSIPTYSGTPQKEMLDKVHSLVEAINKPGIDFFELWNAAEAMGGINESSVSNAFVALKIASGNTLSKEVIINTGESYCAELKSALDTDINSKIATKNKITEQKNLNRNSLSSEITELNNKIVELQNTLKEKNQKLQNIDADFDPKLKEIDDKISNGKIAVDAVIAEMKNVISIANKTIKE